MGTETHGLGLGIIDLVIGACMCCNHNLKVKFRYKFL
jgi:hypothetical protein